MAEYTGQRKYARLPARITSKPAEHAARAAYIGDEQFASCEFIRAPAMQE